MDSSEQTRRVRERIRYKNLRAQQTALNEGMISRLGANTGTYSDFGGSFINDIVDGPTAGCCPPPAEPAGLVPVLLITDSDYSQAVKQIEIDVTVLSDEGSPITERGICYGTSPLPTITSNKVPENDGGILPFTSVFSVSSFVGSTVYCRAYAISENGVGYSSQVSFSITENSVPTISVASSSYSDITTVLSINFDIPYNGGRQVTLRGICYSSSSEPTTSDTVVYDPLPGNASFSFALNLSSYIGSTLYFRGFATNSEGTAYSSEVVVNVTAD